MHLSLALCILSFASLCQAVTVPLLSESESAVAYTASYIAEYSAVVKDTPEETLRYNVKEATTHAAAAAKRGADVFLMPEYGLTGFHTNKTQEDWVPYLIEVPDDILQTTLCGSSHAKQHEHLTSLSCAAKNGNIAIVVDLAEKRPNEMGHNMYNTAVCFDKHGAIAMRSRKFNLYHEPAFDVPTKEMCSEVKSFALSKTHPIRFGLFVCADFVYKFPTSALLADGATDFLAPIAWSNEMPQTEAIGFIMGWSHAHSVNAVFNNHRRLTMSGSAMINSGAVRTSYYKTGENETGNAALILADMPYASPNKDTLDFYSKHHNIGTDLTNLPEDESSWSFYVLPDSGRYDHCNGSFCCSAQYEGNASGYMLGMGDGVDAGGGAVWGIVACGVYYLPNRVLEYTRPAEFGLHSVNLTIDAPSVAQALMLPNIVLTEKGPADSAVPPMEGQYNVEVHSETKKSLRLKDLTSTQLVSSAALYGRVFEKDKVHYDCQ